ncbi:MAG: DNA polymerase III subunit delta [Clostridia bacterium]|nr:DNA polymerase III subunit delta [Clostridia bacterium]
MTEKELYDRTNARKLSGAYLFEGAEELTKQQAVDRVTALLDPGFLDLNLKRGKEPDVNAVLDAAHAVPVFDALCVTIFTEFDDAALFEALQKRNALDTLFSSTDAVILFVRRGTAKETDLVRLFREKGRHVSFEPFSEDRAREMCMRLCAGRRVRLDRPEAYQLVDMVGTDAYRLSNEISKLCDYVGDGGAVTAAVLKTVVTPSVEYEVFPMLNALLAGNKKTAMRMLTEAMKDGQENPLRVAAFLEGRLKQMLIAKELMEDKRLRPEIIKTLGGNPKAAEMTLKNAQKFPLDRLKNAVAAFARINADMKSGTLNETDALILAIYRSF